MAKPVMSTLPPLGLICITPWDKGAPAPALVNFLRQQPISGRVLVPGCGRGHEVREIGRHPQTSVVGLDISPTAVAQAKQLEDSSGVSPEVSFVEGDFFKLPANLKKSFDWLVEHTCFCAIEPQQRPDYVVAASSALRTGGKIFGIFYINPDVEHGPPFAVSKEELSELFDPHFTLLDEWVPKEELSRPQKPGIGSAYAKTIGGMHGPQNLTNRQPDFEKFSSTLGPLSESN